MSRTSRPILIGRDIGAARGGRCGRQNSLLRFRCTQVLIYVAAAMNCGCSGGAPRGAVHGSIKLDGQPIAQGTISFIPIAGSPVDSTWTIVKDGTYSLPASKGPVVGKSRVEIRAQVPTGKTVPAMPPATGREDVMREIMPPRFNAESTLTADISSGDNVLDFDLKSN